MVEAAQVFGELQIWGSPISSVRLGTPTDANSFNMIAQLYRKNNLSHSREHVEMENESRRRLIHEG